MSGNDRYIPARSATERLAQAAALRSRRLVVVDQANETIDLHGTEVRVYPDDPYWIQWKRIDTPQKLLGWIDQLSPKTWVTKDHIRELIWAWESVFDDGDANKIQRGL